MPPPTDDAAVGPSEMESSAMGDVTDTDALFAWPPPPGTDSPETYSCSPDAGPVLMALNVADDEANGISLRRIAPVAA